MLNGCLVNRHTLEIRRLSPTSFFSSPRERSIRSKCDRRVQLRMQGQRRNSDFDREKLAWRQRKQILSL